MIEKDNNFVKKKKIKFKLLHSPRAIKSLHFGSVCNPFTKHCLCQKNSNHESEVEANPIIA